MVVLRVVLSPHATAHTTGRTIARTAYTRAGVMLVRAVRCCCVADCKGAALWGCAGRTVRFKVFH